MTSIGAHDEVPGGLKRYVDRVDRGEFWLAHEELEEVWQVDRRDCYKGLIHVAAALLHAERGYRRGARAKIDSAAKYLRRDPRCPGFDAAALGAWVDDLRGRLEGSEDSSDDLARWAADRQTLRSIFTVPVPEGFAPPEPLPRRVRRHDEGYRTRRDPKRRD